MSVLAKQYLETLQGLIEKAVNEQMDVIEMAGKCVAESVARGGILHIFGVGHSHILAEEGFIVLEVWQLSIQFWSRA